MRTAARRAAMLMGALCDGAGWRWVEVASAAGERVPLNIAPDKKKHTVQTEVAGKKSPQSCGLGTRMFRGAS